MLKNTELSKDGERPLLPVVVLADGPGGLGAVWALNQRGVAVTTICSSATKAAHFSRYPKHKIIVHGDSLQEKHEQLLKTMLELPLKEAALLCTSDETVDFIAQYQKELSAKYRFQLPNGDLLRALNDKKRETALMEQQGIPIPKTVQDLPDSPDELLHQLRLPIIFKPARFTEKKDFPHKNIVVQDRESLQAVYDNWQAVLPRLIAQEVIPGPDSACWICSCTFDAQHRLLDCGIKQKLRAYPPHFGASSLAISRTQPEILEIAQKFGLAVEYVGHASMEFRWDERDNTFKYIEVNPRLPANVCFEEACGLPTVWNSYQVALYGNSETEMEPQRDGIYFIDFWADYFSQTEEGSGRLQSLWGTLKYMLKPSAGQYFRWHDPLPGLMMTYEILKQKVLNASSK